MRDAFESQLAELLRDVGDSVPDGIEPPPDLELRVARRRRQSTATNAPHLLVNRRGPRCCGRRRSTVVTGTGAPGAHDVLRRSRAPTAIPRLSRPTRCRRA